jgi:hypothetical protein
MDGTLAFPICRPFLLRSATRPPGDLSNIGRTALAEAGVIPSEARITISRESRDDVGFREIFVSLDGEQIAILQHGERITVDVSPGPHRLRAHNTLFWKTHDVTLKPGEHVRFTAINRAGWGTFGMLFFLGAMPVYLTFERAPSDADSPSA